MPERNFMISSLVTNIIINLTFEGTHNWPDCNISEVSFLKHPHRHIFYICCKKTVTHNNRQIEIIKFKREILKYINNTYPNGKMNATSCEMLATELLLKFKLYYCKVLEDNENGAEVLNNE